MTLLVSENRLEDSGKDSTLKDKHVLVGFANSQVLMNIVHYCLQCVISLHYWNSLILIFTSKCIYMENQNFSQIGNN